MDEYNFLMQQILSYSHLLSCMNLRMTKQKVWELTANGVIMVSAIGNDGPLYGYGLYSILVFIPSSLTYSYNYLFCICI